MDNAIISDNISRELIELSNRPIENNNFENILMYNVLKKIMYSMFLIAILLLLICVGQTLQLYLLYYAFTTTGSGIVNYINTNVPNLEKYLDEYTLHVKFESI